MGGVKVPCLVDTDSMVSTISESFFHRHFEPWGRECLRSCNWLQLKAANGLAIPYIGYLELEVQLCGKVMPHCGVLVVRDPPGGVPAQVPGVLGMNVIRKCYQELFGQHGLALFSQPCVSEAPGPIVQALQRCHRAKVPQDSRGRAKVREFKMAAVAILDVGELVHHQSILLSIEACPLNRLFVLVDLREPCCIPPLTELDCSGLKLQLFSGQSFCRKQRWVHLGRPCVVLPLYSLVGESQRGRLMFLESRDLELHHANVSCLDDASGMLGELHDHGMSGLHPIGAHDAQVIVVSPAKDRANFCAQAKFFVVI
ncbi:hypothetical protein N1851_002098 [Merluccius polli]|uniref:Uncharacterized protein n=1 Tax=Merluccius polli TaxID=89951 RepID=A0AA47PCH4_MERPO|nr:hypothetical protein N1851_002098 [Merluccius polli]